MYTCILEGLLCIIIIYYSKVLVYSNIVRVGMLKMTLVLILLVIRNMTIHLIFKPWLPILHGFLSILIFPHFRLVFEGLGTKRSMNQNYEQIF